MSGQLQGVGGGAPIARCIRCGDPAVGPCARCREPVCGDCCVLTEGGAKVWAICLGCERGGGRSLRGAWASVIAWIVLPIVGLAAIVAVLERWARR
ncbi:Hypothetical protein A7982_11036 [Minicystis rosea]|nr:Hypothetical protein A7982_11036 [Minicystis rosea]